jgi:hypothetical protein
LINFTLRSKVWPRLRRWEWTKGLVHIAIHKPVENSPTQKSTICSWIKWKWPRLTTTQFTAAKNAGVSTYLPFWEESRQSEKGKGPQGLSTYSDQAGGRNNTLPPV